MNKTTKILLGSLSLLCLGSYVFVITNAKEYKKKLLNANNAVNSLVEMVRLHSDYSGFYQFPASYNISLLDGDDKLLKDVITNDVVALYINKFHCQSCIDNCISELGNHTSNNPWFTPIILASGFNTRELNAMKLNKQLNIPIFLIRNSSLFFDKMGKAEKPFFFRVGQNLEVSNIFFPRQELSQFLNENYFFNIERSAIKQHEDILRQSPISIENPIIDLGAIEVRKKYSVSFKIKNQSNETYLIKSIKSACGCIHVQMDFKPLEPDAVRSINADIYKTDNGKFSYLITLETSSRTDSILAMYVNGFAN